MADIISNLAAWWRMDGTSIANGGTIVDSSGNSRDGTLTTDNGAVNKIVAGHTNQAIVLDGAGDYISGTWNVDLAATPISISAWVYFGDFNAGHENPRVIELQDASYSVQIIRDSGGGLFVTKHSEWQSAISGTQWNTPATGTWYHVVAIFDASNNTTSFYVNNASQSSAANNNIGIGNQASKFYIGARSDLVATSFLSGYIDEVRVYTRALAAADIAELYNFPVNKTRLMMGANF